MQISDWMYAAPSVEPQSRFAHSWCTAYHTTCRDCAAAQAEIAFVEVCFTGTASINKTSQRCTDWLCFWFCLSGSCNRLTVAVDRFIQPDTHSDIVVVKFSRHDHYILFVMTFSVATFLVLLFGILCCANRMDACMRAVSSFQGCWEMTMFGPLCPQWKITPWLKSACRITKLVCLSCKPTWCTKHRYCSAMHLSINNAGVLTLLTKLQCDACQLQGTLCNARISCMSTVSKLQDDHPRLARIVQKQSFKISKNKCKYLLAATDHGCWESRKHKSRLLRITRRHSLSRRFQVRSWYKAGWEW